MAEAGVAIALATRNGAKFLDDQVRSLLQQSDVRVRVLFRDDGSSDRTNESMRRLAEASNGLLQGVVDQLGPTGSAAANFFAILKATEISDFDYFAFADQDDIWLPNKLHRAVECLVTSGAGGYSSDLTAWVEESGKTWSLRKGGRRQTKFDYIFQGASAGCTYVLTRSAATILRNRLLSLDTPYCGGMSHDWTTYAVCRSAGFGWYHDDRSYILYRQHSGNVYGAKAGVSGLAERGRMMASGWYRSHILWLEQLMVGSADEQAVFGMVRRLNLADRIALAARANQFRRSAKEALFLRFALLSGLFR